MARLTLTIAGLILLSTPSVAQGKRLWVLRPTGEMVEYDPATFAVKQKVKVPAEAAQSPQNVSVNHQGQILFVPAVSLPLADSDLQTNPKAWLWNGQTAVTIPLGLKREVETRGSNLSITEDAAAIDLSDDGKHLFWFANQQRRLQREDVDLSVATTWQAWQTDLTGAGREDIASMKLPDCDCPTGACEETCPLGVTWAPAGGVGTFFVMTRFVNGKDGPAYKASTIYREDGGKWAAAATSEPLRRVLDAASNGDVMVEAIPDTGCCGWSNQSDDQTVVLANGTSCTVFDERSTYKNPDYDVSFYTTNARLSPGAVVVAVTIAATAQANQPIQLAEQGQANPEESRQIRKALAQLPAVEVKTLEGNPRKRAFVPHAVLVGWIGEEELLVVQDHWLVVYHVGTGVRHKSNVWVEDASRVFLR
jgi:hypothetical protein